MSWEAETGRYHANLEVVHRYLASVANPPFSLIPLFLCESCGHLVDGGPIHRLGVSHVGGMLGVHQDAGDASGSKSGIKLASMV